MGIGKEKLYIHVSAQALYIALYTAFFACSAKSEKSGGGLGARLYIRHCVEYS